MSKTLWYEDKNVDDILEQSNPDEMDAAIINLFEDLKCMQEEVELLRGVYHYARWLTLKDDVAERQSVECFKRLTFSVRAVNDYDKNMD